jgi:hypothetical protein
VDLNAEQRDTVDQIFRRPSSGNVEWRRVRSLLDEVATVTKKRDGKLEVTLGGETEVFDVPHGKDPDVQMLVDLRRMLAHARVESSSHDSTSQLGAGGRGRVVVSRVFRNS